MIKILKRLALMFILFGGLQLFCAPFVAKLLINRGTGKAVGKARVNIDLDTSDTGAQAKEKIHKQTKFPVENMYLIYHGTVEHDGEREADTERIWEDNETWDEIRMRDEVEIDSEINVDYYQLISRNEAIKRELISAKRPVKKKLPKRKDGLEIKL